MLSSWWRKLVRSVQAKGTAFRLADARQRHLFKPVCEQVEDRVVPTALSIPINLVGSRGGIVTVPINVDVLNDASTGNSGLSGADFVLFYNSNVLSVSAPDVHLGTALSGSPGWTILTNSPSAGELIIGLSTSGGVAGTAGGSIVTVNFHVSNTAPLGSTTPIDLAADANGSPPSTQIAGESGTEYTLNPAPVDGPDSQDGLISISGTTSPPVAANDSLQHH